MVEPPSPGSSFQITVGSLPHDHVMRAIELLGTEVAPAVRTEVARRAPAPVPSALV